MNSFDPTPIAQWFELSETSSDSGSIYLPVGVPRNVPDWFIPDYLTLFPIIYSEQ